MAHIDMNRPDESCKPGVDLWKIVECTEKYARSSGNKMLALKMHRASGEPGTVYDNIMLEGGGWGIGKAKLAALLPADFNDELDPLSFVGRKLWVETSVESTSGKDRLRVNIAGLKHNGFQAEEDVPPGHVAPEEQPAPF